MAITDAGPICKRGEAYAIVFPMFTETMTLSTLVTPTAVISLDNGPFVDTINAPQPLGDDRGMFYLEFGPTETDATVMAVIIVSDVSSVKPMPFTIYPQDTGDIQVSVDSVTSAFETALRSAVLNAPVPGPYATGTLGSIMGQWGNTIPSITILSPVVESGDIYLVRGDDYKDADGRALVWTDDSGAWPDLTGATVTLYIGDRYVQVAATITVPTGSTKQVKVEMTATDTKKLTSKAYRYSLKAHVQSGSIITLLNGSVYVTAQV